MAAWRCGFNLLVLKTSLTRLLRSLVRDIINTREDKIRISAQPCNILYTFVRKNWYMPRAGVEPTSSCILVRSANHYNIREHHPGNVTVSWLVTVFSVWGSPGPIVFIFERDASAAKYYCSVFHLIIRLRSTEIYRTSVFIYFVLLNNNYYSVAPIILVV